MERHAELLGLDFAQMLFDSGWTVAVEKALAELQTRDWLRSDEASGLNLNSEKLFTDS